VRPNSAKAEGRGGSGFGLFEPKALLNAMRNFVPLVHFLVLHEGYVFPGRPTRAARSAATRFAGLFGADKSVRRAPAFVADARGRHFGQLSIGKADHAAIPKDAV
jgi:hypothetical protein